MKSKYVRWSLFAIVVVPFLSVPVLAQEDATIQQRGHEEEVMRALPLDHLSLTDAIEIARTIAHVRDVVRLPESNTIILRGALSDLEPLTRLLKQLDKPEPGWLVDVVLVSGNREKVLRTLELHEERASFSYGDREKNARIDLSIEAVNDGERVAANYSFITHIPGDAQVRAFLFSESGVTVISDGARLPLLAPDLQRHREAMASILGVEGEASELFLKFRQRG